MLKEAMLLIRKMGGMVVDFSCCSIVVGGIVVVFYRPYLCDKAALDGGLSEQQKIASKLNFAYVPTCAHWIFLIFRVIIT